MQMGSIAVREEELGSQTLRAENRIRAKKRPYAISSFFQGLFHFPDSELLNSTSTATFQTGAATLFSCQLRRQELLNCFENGCRHELAKRSSTGWRAAWRLKQSEGRAEEG